MFCYMCGEKVPDGARFCPKCGTKLLLGEKDETQRAAAPEQMSNDGSEKQIVSVQTVPVKTIKLLNRQITFSKIEDYCNKLFAEFNRNAYDQCQIFKQRAREQITDFDTAVSTIDRLFEESISYTVKLGVQILLNNNISHIDQRTFRSKYEIQYFYRKVYIDEIREIETQMNESIEYLRLQREAKRQNRTYWTGGGFGIRGAIVGSMKASILNAGSSALSGIGNTFREVRDTNRIKGAKEKTLQMLREEGVDSISNAVQLCCNGVFWGIVKELEENGIITPPMDLEKRSEKSAAMLNNAMLIMQDVSGNRASAIELIVKAVNIFPYKIAPYVYIYDNFRDVFAGVKMELHELTEYLGLEDEYDDYIIQLMKDDFIQLNEYPEDTLEEVDEKIQKSEDFKHEYEAYWGEKETDSYENLVKKREQIINQMDIDSRTAYGVLYDTAEEANAVNKEMDLLSEIIERHPYLLGREQADECLKEIHQYNFIQSMSNELIRQIEKRLEDFIQAENSPENFYAKIIKKKFSTNIFGKKVYIYGKDQIPDNIQQMACELYEPEKEVPLILSVYEMKRGELEGFIITDTFLTYQFGSRRAQIKIVDINWAEMSMAVFAPIINIYTKTGTVFKEVHTLYIDNREEFVKLLNDSFSELDVQMQAANFIKDEAAEVEDKNGEAEKEQEAANEEDTKELEMQEFIYVHEVVKKYKLEKVFLTAGEIIMNAGSEVLAAGRIGVCINHYQSYLAKNELPLLLYDDTISRNGKDGFIITPYRMIYRNLGTVFSVKIADIKTVEPIEKLFSLGFFINGKERISLTMAGREAVIPATACIKEIIEYLQGQEKAVGKNSSAGPSNKDVTSLIQKLKDMTLQYTRLQNLLVFGDEVEKGIPKAVTKSSNAYKSYAPFSEDEHFIMQYDDTLSENGKEGFVITDQKIYYKTAAGGGALNIKEIDNISVMSGFITSNLILNSSEKISLACVPKSMVPIVENAVKEAVEYLS